MILVEEPRHGMIYQGVTAELFCQGINPHIRPFFPKIPIVILDLFILVWLIDNLQSAAVNPLQDTGKNAKVVAEEIILCQAILTASPGLNSRLDRKLTANQAATLPLPAPVALLPNFALRILVKATTSQLEWHTAASLSNWRRMTPPRAPSL